ECSLKDPSSKFAQRFRVLHSREIRGGNLAYRGHGRSFEVRFSTLQKSFEIPGRWTISFGISPAQLLFDSNDGNRKTRQRSMSQQSSHPHQQISARSRLRVLRPAYDDTFGY